MLHIWRFPAFRDSTGKPNTSKHMMALSDDLNEFLHLYALQYRDVNQLFFFKKTYYLLLLCCCFLSEMFGKNWTQYQESQVVPMFLQKKLVF